MNSPLDPDFDGFHLTDKSEIIANETDSGLPILGEQIDALKSLECAGEDLPQCEVCGQQFLTKKELRVHVTVHLGQPRIILKRCSSLQGSKKRETYCLQQEKKGSLKLTLKKQNHSNFAVINSDLNFTRESRCFEEVAGDKGNEKIVDADNEEENKKHTFENVTINADDDYQNDHCDNTDENYLDNDWPSVEVNEGDSGVGSDMANPLEKEDEADEVQNADHENSNSADKSTPDEDPEAIEATCRETIENLKKLGEQSSIRPIRDMSPKDGKNLKEPPPLSPLSERNSVLSLLAKNSALEICSPRSKKPKTDSTTPHPGPDVSWSRISVNSIDKESEKNSHLSPTNERDSPIDNADATGSILQKFLTEHHEKDISESVQIAPIETEYVSLEKLAETVSTCRVCNEKFADMTMLDDHRSRSGHYQCNVPECSSLVFTSLGEVSLHKSQVHSVILSPSINITPAISRVSPNERSPLHSNSPNLTANSPHSVTLDPLSTAASHQLNNRSPQNSSPHQNHSPTFIPQQQQQQQQVIPPVNFDQLPAPVQQLAQQVQRMPLPHPQMSASLPPGAAAMIHSSNYFMQPPGRPPMYRMPTPQGMQYSHMSHIYAQYGAAPPPPPYPQYAGPPQMHPQMPQQVVRGRAYAPMMPRAANRMPQPPAPRPRLKRPMQPPPPSQRPPDAAKQRRMDLLLPDRNEDADCHVIAQQKRNEGIPVIQNVQGATSQPSARNDSTIHLTDSITLSVRQPGSTAAQPQNSATAGPKKADAKAVANVLAARGITVTPAATKKALEQQQKQQITQARAPQAPAPAPVNVAALNLNSAISIIPASTQRKQQQEQAFAVPQNKQSKSSQDVERPPRPPTVDLTQDLPSPAPPGPVRRGRPRTNLMCQVCDKTFASTEALAQHMNSHRGSNKLLHKCTMCGAQYPTAQDLAVHKQTYHKEDPATGNGGTELAIPVIDLKSPLTLTRLSNLGIQSYIPLSQLSAQTGGCFGLPIITIDGPRNPNSCNLGALGATSILSLGPLKHLTNR